MALIDDREAPSDIPTTNALDQVPDDLLGGPPPPAEIRMSGKTLLTLENPPEPGDELVLLIRVKVNGTGVDLHDNDEEVPYRKAKLVTCWKPGTAEPQPKKTQAELDADAEAEAAKDQPPLFGEDGEPEALGDVIEGEFGPSFSDGDE
ncbi:MULTISPECIES: hypothetical protein [Mycolicibacterium]|uniref:hypothetical protein n=1 Tax=Mycolicibacterium TaxID=1866885 RepID=UPI0007EE20EA|nr:hypothetical protein [Mycolicibacterium fortuitum]OBK04060.1 hypothetical protein A5637_13340 [Mycolicibacterium fortuitum]